MRNYCSENIEVLKMMDNRIFGVTCFLLGIIISPVLAAWLKCYKGTVDNYLVTTLETPLALMNTPCIDSTVPTIIYTFGYRGRSTGPATKAVLSAYVGTRKRNVLLLDWEEEARSGILGIPLGYALYAVPNAKRIGKQLGDSLVKLASNGLNMSHVHLVGHSLGAHLMGYAGRRARQNGYTVPRITGLDPARALYEGTLAVQNGLDRTCARFVDIIHTDPGGYGTSLPSGSVDLWPNYLGGVGIQPGCPNGDFEMFTAEDLCSHDRAWRLFVESISAPTSIVALGAANYDDWLEKNYDHRTNFTQIYLGDLINARTKGNFFLTTNAHSPFGRGREGIKPGVNQIRRRRRNSSLKRFLKYFR